MIGLARWWRQAEQHENALALFRQAIEKNLSDDLMFRTLWDIAALEKKLGREHAALPVLTDLAASRNPWRAAAFVELAKYYERRERNYRAGIGNDAQRHGTGTFRSAGAPRGSSQETRGRAKNIEADMKTFPLLLIVLSFVVTLTGCAKAPKLDVTLKSR